VKSKEGLTAREYARDAENAEKTPASGKPRLLDLFCGAGGCTRGYQLAGFHVTGVDLVKSPRYVGDEFHQCDALEYLAAHGHEYDAVHASPPCQAHSTLRFMPNAREHVSLIEPCRELLHLTGKPFVMENVSGSPLRDPTVLCGTMFGLGVGDAELRRHRLFETNWTLMLPFGMHCKHYRSVQTIGVYGDSAGMSFERRQKMMQARRQVIGVYGGGGPHYARKPARPAVCTVVGHGGGSSIRDGVQQFSTEERREAMGIDWMSGAELSQAIPPAYTKFIGDQLILRVSAPLAYSRAVNPPSSILECA
jgi:DNA (cytosine-5)-methyltransferase 1